MANLKFDVEIPEKNKVKNETIEILRQFVESGNPVAEYIYGEDRNPEAVYNSAMHYAKKEKFPVSVIRRKDRIFFVLKGE